MSVELSSERSVRVSTTQRQIDSLKPIAGALAVLGPIVYLAAGVVNGWPDTPEGAAAMFAGITGTFWALAGLVLVYVAFLGQQVELQFNAQAIADQQSEMELTRQELAGQREHMGAQVEALTRQANESTFFRQCEIVLATIEAAVVTGEKGPHDQRVTYEKRGRLALRQFYKTVVSRIHAAERAAVQDDPDVDRVEGAPQRGRLDRSAIAAAYATAFEWHRDMTEPILDSIASALEIIDSFDTPDPYAQILAGILPVTTKKILYYHVHTGTASGRFASLASGSGILDGIAPDQIAEAYHQEVLEGSTAEAQADY